MSTREICIDTETTGFRWQDGHRVIEIGAAEIVDRKITGETYQNYIDTRHPSDPGALKVHGLTLQFLCDNGVGEKVAFEDFLKFIAGDTIIAHNAPFDVGFINNELARLDLPPLANEVIDTRTMARSSLDVLRKRYGVEDDRTLHGALVDANILAKVYLAMTRGHDDMLPAGDEWTEPQSGDVRPLKPLTVRRPTDKELDAHNAFVEKFKLKWEKGW